MPKKKKKKYNIFKITGIIGSIIFLLIAGLDLTGIFIKSELLLYDLKMKNRESIEENEKIITVYIDDRAITSVGRWPWNLNLFADLVEIFNLYETEMVSFVDIFFDREAEITFNSPEEAEQLKNTLKEVIRQTDEIDNIFEYITDYNEVFYDSVKNYKEVFITNTFQIPEIELDKNEFDELKEFYQNIMGDDKKINLEKMDKFVIKDSSSTGIITAFDIMPPIGNLSEIVKGAGFNRIFLDIDGVLRKYLLVINYNDKVYPSLVLAMIAKYYECPYDKIIIEPGKYIKLSEYNKERFNFENGINIPIDKEGFMLINWTGDYAPTFAHYPFNFIAMHYSFFIGKKILKNFDLETADPGQVQMSLQHGLQESGWLNDDIVERNTTILLLSYYMEGLLLNGFVYKEFLQMFGLQDEEIYRNFWDQIYFNNIIVFEHLEKGKISAFDNIIKEISHQDFNDTETFKHYYEHINYFINKNKVDEIRPLIFPQQNNILIGKEEIPSSLLDLRNKIVFLGLTATGLNAFNPIPYTERYMMHGLAPNAFNTIITNNYIKQIPVSIHYLIMLILSFLPVIMILTLDIKISGFLTLVLLVIFPLISWYYFIHNNLIIYTVAPMILFITSFFVTMIYKLIQDRKEQKAIRGMFSTMVSPEVLKIMESDPNKFRLAGEKREATLFSSDVSGFTTISEGVTARELADILNVYLTPMSNIIMSYDGYCDKYEGDAIKSSFGVPIDDSEHAWKACYATLLQQKELKVIQRMILLKYGVEISARMGVNTGLVSAGNMGSEKKMQYTVMGKAVSLAEELEPINKLFESWIAIGPDTYKKAGDKIETRLLNYLIMGEEHRLPVYELMGWRKEPFLDYWLGKPVPKLILDGYIKMPVEKILSYYHFFTNEKFPSSDLLNYVFDFLNGIKDKCINYIKTNDIIFIYEVKTGLVELEKSIDKYSNLIKDELNDSLLEDVNALLNKSNNSSGWEKIIYEYKSRLKKLLIEQELLQTKVNKIISDKLLSEIDIFDKRVECINKRIRFPKATDEIGKTLSDNLIELLLNKSDNLKISEIEKSLLNINIEIQNNKNLFVEYLKTHSDDYHKLICEYCLFSEEQDIIRTKFFEAREEYLKRNWDKAISIFKEALEIKPDDGPSIMYIKKIEHYKKNPPDENWKGEWIGEV